MVVRIAQDQNQKIVLLVEYIIQQHIIWMPVEKDVD
jgi:hypothetical protein